MSATEGHGRSQKVTEGHGEPPPHTHSLSRIRFSITTSPISANRDQFGRLVSTAFQIKQARRQADRAKQRIIVEFFGPCYGRSFITGEQGE